MSRQPKESKDNKRVSAALAIRSAAATIQNIERALGDSIETLSDPSKCTQKEQATIVKFLKELQSTLVCSTAQIFKNVKLLDPIPSLDYVYSRQHLTIVKPKRPLTTSVSPAAKRPKIIGQDSLEKAEANESPPASEDKTMNPSTVETSPVKAKKALPLPLQKYNYKNNPSVGMNTLPKPKNGAQYTRREVVEILSPFPKNSSTRMSLMGMICDQKLVQVARQEVQQLLKSFEECSRKQVNPLLRSYEECCILDQPWNTASPEKAPPGKAKTNHVEKSTARDNILQERQSQQTATKPTELQPKPISNRPASKHISKAASGPAKDTTKPGHKVSQPTPNSNRPTSKQTSKAAEGPTSDATKPTPHATTFPANVTDPPPPKDGKQYTRVEFIEIVAKAPRDSYERKMLIKNIREQGLVPCGGRNVYKLMDNYEQLGYSLQDLDRPWGARGRIRGSGNYARRPRPTEPVQRKRKKTVAVPELPPPKDGFQYSRVELVEVVSKTEKKSSERAAMVTEILNKGLIPCKRRNIEKLMRQYENEGLSRVELDKPWNHKGRNPLLDQQAVEAIVTELQSKGLAMMDLDDNEVDAVIALHLAKSSIDKGEPDDVAPSRTTIRNYKSMIAALPNVKITNTTRSAPPRNSNGQFTRPPGKFW